ncbi:MAG: SRPBCC domain-containing protein [Propionibacteriaceae bacterium]|jgi:uncharacterized protein YndB with AHSA1/START domain|nr:SRPBCC domain-containing protein [Propionibacteriaceae bacterium]
MTTELIDEKTDHSIVVTQVLAKPLNQVWDDFLQPAGQAALLGAGGSLGDKGDRWQADDGSCGVTRSYHPKEEVRFSWRASEDAPRTLVDLQFEAVDEATTKVTITHDHTGVEVDVPRLTAHWNDAVAFLGA